MKLYGLQKLSMVDYPGKLAATVFTGGCDLRCPFCHNALLVTRLAESRQLEESDVLSFLESRKKLLDAVVLSGGEPLLQPDAAAFLARVKAMGFHVKLDTNGCHPQALKEILSRNLVDYVAMDIKNSREKYPLTTGIPGFDPAPVAQCFDLLMASGVEFELRTTVVAEYHTPQDIDAIGARFAGAPHYYLQNFQDSGNLIGENLHGFSEDTLHSLAKTAQKHFSHVGIRGI